jgi:hypothetical protein
MAFWAYGALAVLIALLFSSLELVQRYEARGLREIFASRYYAGFVALNALFSFLAYWILPAVGGAALNPDLSAVLEKPALRAIVAGFGYLLIVRTSFADFTFRGETVGMGLDLAYKVWSQYLLRHHNKKVLRELREGYGRVATGDTDDPAVFLGTTEFLIEQEPDERKSDMESALGLALHGNPTHGNLCFTLYRIIRDMTEDEEDAQNEIERIRREVQSNPNSAEEWKRKLPWIYE